MKQQTSPDRLTELEGAAMATLAQIGPCTPYALMDRFRSSPSEFWSGSTGAIYPLVRRLVAAGLVETRKDSQGKRARELVELTKTGRAAMKTWLTDASAASRLGFDPLRTRLLFLELLSKADQRKALDAIRGALSTDLEPPAPATPHVLALHKAWVSARRAAFEEIAAYLDGTP